MADGLRESLNDLVEGAMTCVDRIVLNAYNPWYASCPDGGSVTAGGGGATRPRAQSARAGGGAMSPRPRPFVPTMNAAEEGTLKGQLINGSRHLFGNFVR
jgi:hypothetical protein